MRNLKRGRRGLSYKKRVADINSIYDRYAKLGISNREIWRRYIYPHYAICGTRGWLFDVGEPHDEKVMNREIGRLRMSLDAAEPGLEKLVFLHYPPVYTGTSAPEIVATLKEYGIRTCYYGHLHGNAIRYAVQGEVDGIRYKLVSADGLRFCPYRIN